LGTDLALDSSAPPWNAGPSTLPFEPFPIPGRLAGFVITLLMRRSEETRGIVERRQFLFWTTVTPEYLRTKYSSRSKLWISRKCDAHFALV